MVINNLAVAFMVKEIPIKGDLMLAPMDGLSDMPFRLISRNFGSSMSYSEFINALDIVNKTPYLEEKLIFQEAERPFVYQLFDDDPERLISVAKFLRKRAPDIIDINMGCPSKQVSSRGAGAGLLRDPNKIALIISRLSHELDIPISGKIRLGWDSTHKNYLEVAHIIEDNGGALIAVHARTKVQAYGGKPDWDAIAEIKQALSIPVIGNGDVCTVSDIEMMKTYTGCDGVMIGRGALGNPWIFSRRDRDEIPKNMVLEAMIRHLDLMVSTYGSNRGLLHFRKHAVHYLHPYSIPKDIRLNLLTTPSIVEFKEVLEDTFEKLNFVTN